MNKLRLLRLLQLLRLPRRAALGPATSGRAIRESKGIFHRPMAPDAASGSIWSHPRPQQCSCLMTEPPRQPTAEPLSQTRGSGPATMLFGRGIDISIRVEEVFSPLSCFGSSCCSVSTKVANKDFGVCSQLSLTLFPHTRTHSHSLKKLLILPE